MNRFKIRDILNSHKEHFRVLPTLAYNELNGIIADVDKEEQYAIDAMKLVRSSQKMIAEPVKEPKKRVVGKRAKKTAKKSKRP